MSRTHHKGDQHKEYWGPRPFNGANKKSYKNKWLKKMTHRIERARAKSELKIDQ